MHQPHCEPDEEKELAHSSLQFPALNFQSQRAHKERTPSEQSLRTPGFRHPVTWSPGVKECIEPGRHRHVTVMLLTPTGAQACFKSLLALMEGVLAAVVLGSLVAILFPKCLMSPMKAQGLLNREGLWTSCQHRTVKVLFSPVVTALKGRTSKSQCLTPFRTLN